MSGFFCNFVAVKGCNFYGGKSHPMQMAHIDSNTIKNTQKV